MVTSPRSAGPSFNCQPPHPKRYNPCIGLIGCGGISEQHLRAYQKAGYRVIALCDINLTSAEQRRDEFFPQAEVMTDYRRLLDNKEIEVVDITTHPEDRVALIGDSSMQENMSSPRNLSFWIWRWENAWSIWHAAERCCWQSIKMDAGRRISCTCARQPMQACWGRSPALISWSAGIITGLPGHPSTGSAT